MLQTNLQAFAAEQLEGYEIFRTCMLRHTMHNFTHVVLRDALQRWFAVCKKEIENSIKIQTSLVIHSLLMRASEHIVLLRTILDWRRYVEGMQYLVRSSNLDCQLRHLESLCIQLKVQRAQEAYDFLQKSGA